MVRVKHAGDSVEAETVELILFHPEAQVAEKEAQDFVTAIVEQSAVPQVVAAFRTFMEIEMVAAIEHVQAVEDVFRSVTVDHVE